VNAVEIKPLALSDAGVWWQLRLEALERDPEAFSSSAVEHQSLSPNDVAKRLDRGDGSNFVIGAFIQGRLVGMAGFVHEKGPKVRHKGRIWGVYVAAEFRNQGIGRRILLEILQRCALMGELRQVLLSVAVSQTAATKLYQSLGFRSFGREPRSLRIGDRFIDEEYMVLQLP